VAIYNRIRPVDSGLRELVFALPRRRQRSFTAGPASAARQEADEAFFAKPAR
jgi:hypothetical protein